MHSFASQEEIGARNHAPGPGDRPALYTAAVRERFWLFDVFVGDTGENRV